MEMSWIFEHFFEQHAVHRAVSYNTKRLYSGVFFWA